MSKLAWLKTFRSYALRLSMCGLVMCTLVPTIRQSFRPLFQAATRSRLAPAVNTADATPWKIPLLVKPIFSPDSIEATCVKRFLQQPPAVPLSVPSCCHLLRLYGLDTFHHPRLSSGNEIIRILTDQSLAEKYFGKSVFFQSRSGLRYKLASPRTPSANRLAGGESHRDLCLATFAELGLPLSTHMPITKASFTLRDLLTDSVENFNLGQEEPAWTAIAYSLYLGRQKGWSNRDGESFTFDDMAKELLQRPFRDASCGGTHLLYAMTVLLRSDSSVACLSGAVRETIARRLRECVSAAMVSQAHDGSWGLAWHAPIDVDSGPPRVRLSDTSSIRLLVTGHLLEWMELLPLELQPPANLYRRTAQWLCTSVERISPASQTEEFCPYTHAVCAVRNLIEKGVD